MSLQNTVFTIQLGPGANFRLANAVISTGEEGATIQFGSVNFPFIVTQNTIAPVSTTLAQDQVRKTRGGEIPRKRTSVFERLSAPEAPTLKRRVIGRVPIGTLATLPTEPFALGRHDVKASLSGAKLSRRQRRKRNAELRAQQLLPMGTLATLPTEPFALGRHDVKASSSGAKLSRSQRRKRNAELRARQLLPELPASHIQQTPSETLSPAREENIYISENARSNFNNASLSEADTTAGNVLATRDSYLWGNPASQSLEVSRAGSSTLREDSNVPVSKSTLSNVVTTVGPSRSRLQEIVVLDMLGYVEEDDSLFVSDLYESRIQCRAVFDEDPLAWQYREVSIHFLRDIILHLDPHVPKTYYDFVEKANKVLNCVACVGLREEVLRFWERVCHQVEFLIEKLKTFNWVHFNASLLELKRRVECCGATTDLARDDLNKSIEIAKRQQNTWANSSTEFESYSSKLKKLWQEITTLLSCRAKVLETLHHNMRDIVKGQQSCQLRQQTFEVAEAAFIRAKEEWKIAQAEQPSFLRLMSHLDHLKAQLAEL